MRGAVAVVVAAALAGWPVARARAEPDADALAKEADQRAAVGDFVGAAAKFRAAHAIDPRPDLLCNVGVAYYKAKDLPRAHLHLGRCMTRGSSLDPTFLATVTAVFRALEAKLRETRHEPVDITVAPPGATIVIGTFGPDEPIVGSALVWLPAGTHRITVRAEGYEVVERDIEARGGSSHEVRIVLPKAAITAAPAARRSKRPAIIATAITGAVGIAAGIVYLAARAKADDASAHALDPDPAAYDALVDDARRFQYTSWGLAAGAAVGAGVSGYLWYRASRPGVVVEAAPTAGGAAVRIRGRF